MAMNPHAFVGSCIDKLTGIVSEKVVMVLGVKDELKRLQRRMVRIQIFLEAAERGRLKDPAVNHWVSELKDVAYDADDIIDLCRIQGATLLADQPSPSEETSVCFYFSVLSSCLTNASCFDFSLLSSCFTNASHRYRIAERIKILNDKLEEIYKDRLQFNFEENREKQDGETITAVNTRQTSPSVEFDVVGSEIEDATKELVKLIVEEQMNKWRVFAVTGMGGMGKTTLAQKIYNNKKIQNEFQIKVWVCVSQSYNEIELLQQVIRGAKGNCDQARTKAELETLLLSTIHGKSLFLVLDDVWRADVWISLFRNPLQSVAAIVRILVTTRDENVAREMRVVHIHPVKQLSTRTGWEMLCRKIFVEGEENEIRNLEDLGIKIVEKCDGLPLAIKAIAGVLAKKGTNRKEWEKVLKNDAWSMNNLPEELPGALYLSYDDLPSPLKQCFLYCALLPEDDKLFREDLILMWVAEGFVKEREDYFVEDIAKDYYKELISRNLLQPDFDYYDSDANIQHFRMHDLLRSLAKFLSRDEIFSENTMATTSSGTKLRRLSIENEENISSIVGLIVEQKCLRTLFNLNGIRGLNYNQLVGLTGLRVLLINFADIESIPNSIGDLIHLRYLDLDCTNIKELPESIGSLTNLQFLYLCGCHALTTLPKAITKLHNLRRLSLYETPLVCIPEGISRLKEINDLNGFVVADPREPEDSFSNLEELNSLYNLRKLFIRKMERAQRGAASLQKLTHLYFLGFSYTEAKDRPDPTEEDIKEIEDVIEELRPPQYLERLDIKNFFGSRYPKWMKSPSFGECLPHLKTLWLVSNISCTELPPVGELPQLKGLYIKGAASVKNIGPEFVGVGVRDVANISRRIAFPNLIVLELTDMPELEAWSFREEVEGSELGREHAQSLSKLLLLPRLETLSIEDCPKLKAFPKGLEQTKMKELYIEKAHSLRVVENLHNLTEKLRIWDNQSLEKVSHLPSLKVLVVINCPALKYVEKLDSLQQLVLFDMSVEGIPEWLARLLEERKPTDADDDDDFLFKFRCGPEAFSRLLKGGVDWPIIEGIPQVIAFDAVGGRILHYSRKPVNYVVT